ncbi:MAG: Crp/Fnr family transcriptional regulator [Gomphosphaeria aponina SAG 52.96 = DSM 107014]|uniref:Crp/Fnr family transcriptional regulator n=1 Tax=Gomphosphaeria aponina SAG 52.96 = DSM 107014 TaxID=1521640 RepID=A0A941JKW5_9CHRO|nr:Crp/Fnr family transcriptional regulator [Gomphosphaeria aponina SAG 52.96 = DSM 107014]
MAAGKKANTNLVKVLTESNFLFRELDEGMLAEYLSPESLKIEKLFSNRPVYTAFVPNEFIDVLYILVDGGPVIVRSTPLDRIISLTYPGGCFGMRSLPLSYGIASRSFPSSVEAYKTTSVIQIPLAALKQIYEQSEVFRDRYNFLFQLREKFQYHLLNCSTYPPQAVAALLRGLIYQERELGSMPDADGVYIFDLPVDVIAHTCQLNHRTVEQVLKGMQKEGLIETAKTNDDPKDTLRVIKPNALKEVYSATRDKVSWWPLH